MVSMLRMMAASSPDELVDGGFDYDSSAFDSDAGGWDGSTLEQTLLDILKPVLVDVPVVRGEKENE